VLRLSVVTVAFLTAGCATTRGPGERKFTDLDRAEIARCRFDDTSRVTSFDPVADLAGEYRVFMTSDDNSGTLAAGLLVLERAPENPEGSGAAAILIGTTDIDAGSVGARVPGDARSVDASGPGVGVYAFTNPNGSPGLTVVARLGSEANRRDRQRFDGAHTTLRIASISAHRFGGTWTSAEGAGETGGDFCAVRS
jgi:hypothetical protein